MTVVGERGGGYDDGYQACPCFWGQRPGWVVEQMITRLDLDGKRVLDLGCGEGRNAAALATAGCQVTAVDISSAALKNGRRAWPDLAIEWVLSDALDFDLEAETFDIVIAYGLMHCLRPADIDALIHRMKQATKGSGYNVLSAFNDRYQDLSGHPGFHPTLLSHAGYIAKYRDWDVEATDDDLHETHPHNGIPHVHSLTWLVAKRP